MPFGRRILEQTLAEYVDDIRSLVAGPKTLVYLDTNILAALYALHKKAREDFYRWCEQLLSETRLIIPGWVLHEFSHRVVTDKLQEFSVKKPVADVTAGLVKLRELSSFLVDDQSAKPAASSRGEFLQGLVDAIGRLEPYLTVLAGQFDPGTITNEINRRLGPAVAPTDMHAIYQAAFATSDFRASHRIPPGFQDRNKHENRHGDLLVWLEIIDRTRAVGGGGRNVVLLTNDVKNDWGHTPPQRQKATPKGRLTEKNDEPKIFQADPRLRHEIRSATGVDRFEIVTLQLLAMALSGERSCDFTHFASALQVGERGATDLREENLIQPERIEQTATESELSEEAPPPLPKGAGGHVQLTYRDDALADEDFPIDESSQLGRVLDGLKSHNWYAQNAAMELLDDISKPELGKEDAFVLGRNIYQAAEGNARGALSFMRNLPSQLSRFGERGVDVAAGMTYEVYFDSSDRLRERPKFDRAPEVLALLGKRKYAQVKDFIHSKLRDEQAPLIVFPGEEQTVPIRVLVADEQPSDDKTQENSGNAVLTSLVVAGRELVLEPLADAEALNVRWENRSRFDDVDSLKASLSRVLLVPPSQIVLEFSRELDPDAMLVLPRRHRLGWVG